MRWRAIVACVVVSPVMFCVPARGQEKEEAQLKSRVERIIAEMSDPNASVRDRADLKLQNLPLQAYPLVTAIYARDKDALDPESKSRIDNSIEMFKALSSLEE